MDGTKKSIDTSKLIRTPVQVRSGGKVYQSYRYKRPADPPPYYDEGDGKLGQSEAAKKEPGFERAGNTVDGMEVLGDIPNRSSISASLNEYEVLSGIREVPMSAFSDPSPHKNYYAKNDIDRVHALAEAIKQSGKIKPLIVVIDKEGPYILEGGHRWSALGVLGKKSFPALVVRDTENYDIEKSLTFSGRPLQGRRKVHGMDISIENKKGSTRRGKDADGHAWATKMHADYGYIRGTVGKDKDHLDCYVGPNDESEKVFVIHQNNPTTGKYDEDKVMLGFDSAAEAKALYMRQYDRPGFFGSVDETDIETFKAKAFADSSKGKRLVIKAITEDYDRKFYAAFLRMIQEKGVGALKKLEGYPEGLDLENCDIIRYEKDRVYFAAGGDWQHPVRFAVTMKGGNLVIAEKFYDTQPQKASERRAARRMVEGGIAVASNKFVVKAMKMFGSKFYTEESLRAGKPEEVEPRKVEGSGRLITRDELREASERMVAQVERRYPDELAVGIKVEMEHTDDPDTAKMIAVAHLQEHPDYYKKLIAAGLVDEPEAIKVAKRLGDRVKKSQPPDAQKIVVWMQE